MTTDPLWDALDRSPRRLSFAEQHAQDRAEAVEWARQAAADPALVFLDTETTDRHPDSSYLVQIGIVAADGGVLLDALVNPLAEISEGARKVHGIGSDNVRQALSFPQLYPALLDLLRGKRVLIYNAAFDTGVLNTCRRRHGLPPIPVQSWECLMRRYSAFLGIPNNDRQRARGNDTPYLWPQLPALEAGKAHGAVADCRSARAVLGQMARG